ncbi:cysteine-rich small domain-containing protein [Desulfohalovibrio reitneri]|uniref:cysteine-rich small domain-containing protein n=1 Tax=Desulfohalovibrio reitneri TaxID=1307759 RepID=UPI0004A70F91|nr:cysteine-rich small domain-containing protein [Desulfohalovibrio reitneri]
MQHSHRFFSNRDCQYFPCHANCDPEAFNCLFCFCPLYFIDCGGDFRLTENGLKDCTPCAIPHCPDGYDHVLAKLKEEMARRQGDL